MNLKPPSENQSRIIWLALTALAIAVLVTVTAAFIWGMGKVLNLLSPVLWPLAIAAVLAYLLDPAVNWLQHHKVSRTWAIVIVFFAGMCVFGGILASVVPQLVQETNQLINKIPNYKEKALTRIENWANTDQGTGQTTNSPATNTNVQVVVTNPAAPPREQKTGVVVSTNSNSTNSVQTNSVSAGSTHIRSQIISSAKSWLGQAVPKIVHWILGLLSRVTSLVDVAIALILIPIYTFYFLREKREIKSHWKNYLPIRDSHTKDELVFILSAVNQYMVAFFRGQVLVAFISGALYTIGYLCLGMDYAFLLGFVAMILIIIPFIGAIINGFLALILAAVQFGDLFHPLMIVVLFAIVQSLESFLYSPRIMGNRVNLHPVVVIIALMIGMTLLGGLLGGILAIPLAAALRVLLFRYIWKKPEAAVAKP